MCRTAKDACLKTHTFREKKHTSKYKKRRQSARQPRRHRRYTDAGVSQQSREHLTDKQRHNQHRSCDEELSRHGRDDPSGDVHWDEGESQISARRTHKLLQLRQKHACSRVLASVRKSETIWRNQWWTKIGGTQGKAIKGGPRMTSSYSANRNKTFWSNLGRGYASHPKILLQPGGGFSQ